jgi:hypothetical protein
MFLLGLKGGQKGSSYFSFPISVHRVACSVMPTSLALSLAHLFYRMVFGNSNIHESPAAHVQSISQGVSKLAEEAELKVNAFYRPRLPQGNPN